MNNLEIPDRIKLLPKDHRGFPIPYVVLIDKEGQPHFKINDESKGRMCVLSRICHVCGQKLVHKDYWFIGGQLSAYHPYGAFNDGATHYECGLFALKICPYLTNNKYTQKTDLVGLMDKLKGKTDIYGLHNPTQMNDRLPFFLYVKSKDYTFRENGPLKTLVLVPKKPYEMVEYYKEGERIQKAEAKQIILDRNEKLYIP